MTAPRGGLYVLELRLSRSKTTRIGRLGRHRFPAGLYRYVGSARRGLAARIARHARRAKKAHWHIDYLRPHARWERAWVWPETSLTECELAERLCAAGGRAVPRFGASDCRCAGHLLRVQRREAGPAESLPSALGGVLWDAGRPVASPASPQSPA